MVFWFTGDERAASLNPSDVAFMKDFMDHGGGLFLTGQDVAEHLSVFDSAFLTDYLNCSYGGNAEGTQWEAVGQGETEIGGDSVHVVLVYESGGAGNQTSPDYLVPEDEAEVNFRYWAGQPCGVEIDSDDYRAVLFSFGFESINDNYAHREGYGSRSLVAGRIIDYLEERPAMANRPPDAFSLESPVDGDSIEGARVTLVWHETSDPDLLDPVTYTLLCSKSDAAPWEHTIEGLTDTVYTLENLEYGFTYYWKVIATDSHSAETESGLQSFYVMRDLEPPAFAVRLIPNPVIPSLLDVYAYPTEPLESAPSFRIETPSVTDSTTMVSGENRSATTYLADYRIEEAGSYTVTICGTDMWENYGCTDATMSAAPLFADEPSVLQSYTGLFRLSVERHSVSSQSLLLILDEPTAGCCEDPGFPEGFSPVAAVTVKLSGSSLNRDASLAADLATLQMPEEQVPSVALLFMYDAGPISVPVRYDPQSQTLSADISRLGTYVLGKLEAENDDLLQDDQLPAAYRLYQNVPNPFNPRTLISFDLPEPAHVKLTIYNVLGQEVITLADGRMDGGSHEVDWDGKAANGNRVSSGIYFYRLLTDSFADTKKMVLLK
jgi:hypothetical protein